MEDSPASVLQALGEELFARTHAHDPLNATLLGLTEFDGALPDLRPAADDAAAAGFTDVAARAAALDDGALDADQRVDRAALVWMARAAASDAEHRLWEAGASAAGYVSPQALVFQAVPATPIGDDAGRARLRERVEGLAAHFDALAARYLDAADRGRPPTATGVQQALDQLRAHLARPLEDDVLAPPGLGAQRAGVAAVVEHEVRPAMRRLAGVLAEQLAPVARGDEAVGIGAVAGGAAGYAAAVARHTSLPLEPRAVHDLGWRVLAELEEEWSRLGREALGEGDPAAVRAGLRQRPELRFETSQQVLDAVTEALVRAEAAGPRYLPPFEVGPCVVEEIDPAEEGNAPLAYYRPAAPGRPGAHCVLTASPRERYRFEYEALAFHESVPGHHLQLSIAQGLPALPRYRRHVDAQLCAAIEGWGLYAERLADELGLYSSPLARLGMLSFDALRACRLVVDTGMHALGWSRQQAVDLITERTATPAANVRNEVDRYIAWPGQACAYMVGRRELVRLRERSRAELGATFDLGGFHGAVLGSGPLPLTVLDGVVADWSTALGAPR